MGPTLHRTRRAPARPAARPHACRATTHGPSRRLPPTYVFRGSGGFQVRTFSLLRPFFCPLSLHSPCEGPAPSLLGVSALCSARRRLLVFARGSLPRAGPPSGGCPDPAALRDRFPAHRFLRTCEFSPSRRDALRALVIYIYLFLLVYMYRMLSLRASRSSHTDRQLPLSDTKRR
jgi:hypothetical protein